MNLVQRKWWKAHGIALTNLALSGRASTTRSGLIGQSLYNRDNRGLVS